MHRKSIYKHISFLMVIILLVGCAPKKYSVKYDMEKPSKSYGDLSQKRMGILMFEDARPEEEKAGGGGWSTFTFRDTFFEEPVPTFINSLMVSHFNNNLGNNSITGLEKYSDSVNLEYLKFLSLDKKADYLLIGDIQHYTMYRYDPATTMKFLISIPLYLSIIGAPIGALLFGIGEYEYTMDIGLGNLALIELSSPRIVWRGSHTDNITVYNSSMDLFAVGMNPGDGLYPTITKKANDKIFESIYEAYTANFPDAMTVEESAKYIENRKTLKNPTAPIVREWKPRYETASSEASQ